MSTNTIRFCRKCEEVKPTAQFYGRNRFCIPCARIEYRRLATASRVRSSTPPASQEEESHYLCGECLLYLPQDAFVGTRSVCKQCTNKQIRARALAKLGASKGGKARADRLSPQARSEQASRAGSTRWAKTQNSGPKRGKPQTAFLAPAIPTADYKGFLNIMDVELPCYVLDTKQRVIGRVAVTEMLSGIKGGGGLEKYLGFHR